MIEWDKVEYYEEDIHRITNSNMFVLGKPLEGQDVSPNYGRDHRPTI